MKNITQQVAANAAKIAVVESEIEDCKKEVADAKVDLESALTERNLHIATILLNSAGQELKDLNIHLQHLNVEEQFLNEEMNWLQGESDRWTGSVCSCYSNLASGRYPAVMHERRDGKNQKVFTAQVLKRDRKCIAIGELDRKVLIAAHIVPVSRNEFIDRDDVYHLRNGVLLREDLEDQYDRFEWFFDECGQVKVQFNGWPHKKLINTVSIAINDGPGADLILMHNEHAEERAVHHCPDCWKVVGKLNIDAHRDSNSGSCINGNFCSKHPVLNDYFPRFQKFPAL